MHNLQLIPMHSKSTKWSSSLFLVCFAEHGRFINTKVEAPIIVQFKH